MSRFQKGVRVDVLLSVEDEAKTIHCECGAVIMEPCARSGSEDQMVEIEWMPKHLRASHEAAGSRGKWPGNGALHLRVERDCAEYIMQNDGEWSAIVG